jgi:hypothetical protein
MSCGTCNLLGHETFLGSDSLGPTNLKLYSANIFTSGSDADFCSNKKLSVPISMPRLKPCREIKHENKNMEQELTTNLKNTHTDAEEPSTRAKQPQGSIIPSQVDI